MEDYKKTIKDRLNILPQPLQVFIKNEAWRNNVSKIASQSNLSEEQSASLENEVFLVLLCFSQTKDFLANVKNNCSVDENTAQQISNFINGTVFGVIMKEIKPVWASMLEPAQPNTNIHEKPKTEEVKNSIGDSFEQAILNQVKAMQIARPAIASAGMPVQNIAHTTSTTAQPPVDLPIMPSTTPTTDPYRETL